MKQAGIFTLSCVVFTVFIHLLFLVPAHSTFLYKTYDVHYDKGREILCETYVVQKNDWVYKLLREKGEISQQDYPLFLSIFKRLNPHIVDVDFIRVGQRIVIPLKFIQPNTFPQQATGRVKVPFVNISKVAHYIKSNTIDYQVKPGDCVSKIIADKFGNFGSSSYKQGISLFSLINPDMKDLNLLRVGQHINIPATSILSQPWFSEISKSGLLKINPSKSISTPAPNPTVPLAPPANSDLVHAPTDASKYEKSPLEQIADIIDAKLLNKGTYFFPQQGKSDFGLNLSTFPVLQLADNTRIIVSQNLIAPDDFEAVKSFWGDVRIISMAPQESSADLIDALFSSLAESRQSEQVRFTDHGIEVEVRAQHILSIPAKGNEPQRHICISNIKDSAQKTPWALARYLDEHDILIRDLLDGKLIKDTTAGRYKVYTTKDVAHVTPMKDEHGATANDRYETQKSFVQQLCKILGFEYTKNVSITFPYAGVQIEAMANLITAPDQTTIFLDFGNIYGDAFHAIRQAGFSIIHFNKLDDEKSILEKLSKTLHYQFHSNPTIFAAKRPLITNTAVTFPGFLLTDPKGRKKLISKAKLDINLVQFLLDQNYRIIILSNA